ncbi:hypothetical protein NrS5_08 [Nitratiruptor phage NrS-5]|uniref:hypothetical protein n=1 Tax=unclassified Nitratiruptor TaxID=2624044 RepID=UPI001916C938|nr:MULTISPECIES: hypothetical protein [unclassified Nitratiruptor]BCD61712.1 hypothetical protein NitYY0813_C0572 [Nitratiruptor sp. YY08-13]BCD65647.1 hypothetical protein NitYY0826_C0574 [Nitratiruptor sp. YY08-26]BCD83190.1 hypothetical protein NrS4_08 [Nitratiruptor phage NrS-4]BCD83249.1 hypothetical protein NrS5_08 [Nitratiruptor phage NrS-5]
MDLNVGGYYKYNTSNFLNSYLYKKYHNKKCKLVYISPHISNYGEAVFDDGKKIPVLLEYLKPASDRFEQGLFAFSQEEAKGA